MSDAFWMGQQPYDPTQANRDAIVQAILAQQDAAQGIGGQTSSGSLGAGTGTGATGPGGTTGLGPQGWGGSAVPGSDFMSGAPPGGSMFGTGDRSSLADPGAFTTAQASMVGDPLGESGAQSVDPFGGRGYDTSQASQDKAAADRAALAESAMGRAPQGNPLEDASQAFGSTFGRSFEGFNAPAQTAPGLPAGYSTTAQPGATPVTTTSFTQPSSVRDMFDPHAPGWTGPPAGNVLPEGWDPTSMPSTPQPTSTYVGRVTPNSYTQPATPGRAPGSTPATSPATTPGAVPGGGYASDTVSFGYGGPTDPTGGYAGGPGNVGGFGSGYAGSSEMGNTQGGQGFTTGGGGFSNPGGMSMGAFSAGFEAGAAAAMGAMSGNEGMGTGGAGGGEGGGGGGGGGGGQGGGGSDPGGSSPGGVG